MPVKPLVIQHVEGSNPCSFTLIRHHDLKSVQGITIASPYAFTVTNQPESRLMTRLGWYLETFLAYPYPPETANAEHLLAALQGWGTEAFNALFDHGNGREWLKKCDLLQVQSDDPKILSWPWEALFDPRTNYVAHSRRIERRLNKVDDPAPLPDSLPLERVNILLVVARPFDNDVGYHSIARPLVELLKNQRMAAHVDVLRPPTFEKLRQHLRTHPGYYHVLHFDGHGSFANGGSEGSTHQLQASQGCLIFEDTHGQPDPKQASELSTLLREYAVPAVVLNACQSGMLDVTSADAYSSVATSLLKGGVRSVVAMAYSLYVSGAQVFLPAFYGRLFEAGSVAEGVRAGRQQMLAEPLRICARGRFPLQDWLLPVLYQQAPLDFTFAAQAKWEQAETKLPVEVQQHRDAYGFVGRDKSILQMERALHRQTPAILVQGLGGVGKTTLAHGFLRWLDDTGGLDGALWFDFRDIRTAEYVINQTGQMFYGKNFGIAKNKLELLAEKLRDQRVVMVWDNFESTATNLTDEDRALLSGFLDAIRGGRGKVIITSRSPEEWLGPARRFPLPLRGLDGEARWEYCEAIVQDMGLQVERKDPALVRLMDQLAGHPLAMRAVLPKLETMSAGGIAEALRKNIEELGLDPNEEQGRLFGTLRFVEQGLDAELRPLLGLVGLHEGFVAVDYLEAMAKQVNASWTRDRVDRLMAELGSAGLLTDVGNATFEMHPLLTSYLRRQVVTEECQRAFVDLMGRFADQVARKQLHEQRVPFLRFGVSFHYALDLAERLAREQDVSALTQALASYALNSRNFGDAKRLYARQAQHSAGRGHSELEAAAYHQLGIVAEEERDFAGAREWYLKSLAIKEQQGNLHGAAISYHQLGRVAEEERDFAGAREWYLKSLAIEEQQGNLHGAASSYHQLGSVAEEERDFAGAREWYLKSLAIKEQQGNLHGAASSYHQLEFWRGCKGILRRVVNG